MTTNPGTSAAGEDPAMAAAVAGDERAFVALAERYRPELRVHCYRMLSSYDEAEDLVQETLLRAWRRRDTYRRRATFRAWLYRIATNACLDAIDRRGRTATQGNLTQGNLTQGNLTQGSVAMGTRTPPPAMVPGLQPYPDALLDQVAATAPEPDAALVAKETVELAFLVAIQLLPARQRAALILRDVLGWSIAEIADLLESSSASINSALQRARPTLKESFSRPRTEWTRPTETTPDEQQVLRAYLTAIENADEAALGELLSEDVRVSQQPWAGGNMTDNPIWYQGREVMVDATRPLRQGSRRADAKTLVTRANRQPAFGMYVRGEREAEYRGFALTVARIVDGRITELAVFHPDLLPTFGLPEKL